MTHFADFTSLFFPRSCKACDRALVRGEIVICTHCIAGMPRTNYVGQNENAIELKMRGRLPIKHGWAFLKFSKGGIVQRLLHQLKYNSRPEIGILLGKLFGEEIASKGFMSEFDMIIPIPLHTERLRKRGYNQSTCFASGLAESLDIELNEKVSVRKTDTQTQTSKSKTDRWENVKDVFEVTGDVMNKRILLVDDVITTGATIEACGRHIIDQGSASLSIACIAEVL